MADQHSTPPPPFPLTQRELVGLALQRGARRPASPATDGGSQRDRVRASLARGVGTPARRTSVQ